MSVRGKDDKRDAPDTIVAPRAGAADEPPPVSLSSAEGSSAADQASPSADDSEDSDDDIASTAIALAARDVSSPSADATVLGQTLVQRGVERTALSIRTTGGMNTSVEPPRIDASGPITITDSGSLSDGGEAVTSKKYRVLGELGKGGGGDVFEVRDNDLRRTVALKRLKKQHTDPGLLSLFLQEAQLTAQLEHPNIVPVHDLGATATGEPFFTMKRVRGETLHDVLTRLKLGDAAATARFTRTRLLIVFL